MSLFQSHKVLFLTLLSLALLGAGCARKPEAVEPSPPPAPVSQPAPPARQPSGTATAPGAAEQVSQTPSSATAQVNCPVTPEIIKSSCGLEGEITPNPFVCTFDAQRPFKYPVFQVSIKSFRQFAPGLNKDSGTLAELIEARRVAMNQILERSGLGNSKCNRIETRTVANLGDEALLAPLTFACDPKTNAASIKDMEKAPWLLIRKGNTITEVASYQGDVEGKKGCSSQEVLGIARQHVLPALD